MGESFRLLRPPQAQEYADAKWALGLRLHDATDDAIEKSVNRGDIFRTHIMRPLAHLVMHADLEALVTSGPRRGKQFTYMLLEERVPPARMLGGEEALAELTRRYFYQPRPRDAARLRLVVGSHRGRRPAGVWRSSGRRSSTRPSGLSSTPSPRPQRTIVDPAPQFLPWFDEYTVAYKARSLVFGPESEPHRTGRDYATLSPAIIVKGKAVAFWKRILKKDGVVNERMQAETEKWQSISDVYSPSAG